jgi:hypothetical protein
MGSTISQSDQEQIAEFYTKLRKLYDFPRRDVGSLSSDDFVRKISDTFSDSPFRGEIPFDNFIKSETHYAMVREAGGGNPCMLNLSPEEYAERRTRTLMRFTSNVIHILNQRARGLERIRTYTFCWSLNPEVLREDGVKLLHPPE